MAEAATTDDEADVLSVSVLQRQYDDYRTSKRAERDEGYESEQYYHADQWTSEELGILADRHQPPVTYNREARKIDAIVGLVERLRQDPKAYPRTPEHAEGAELCTNVLNYVTDRARWKDNSPMVARAAAIGPVGGIEFDLVKGDEGDPDIDMHPIDKRNFFYDPRARRLDFSDARYMGIAKYVDLDVAQEMFPDFADRLKDMSISGQTQQDGSTDDARDRQWTLSNERSIFLVEHYYIRRGTWRFTFYAGSQELKSGTSPYPPFDDRGPNGPRFRAFSANIDHDGDRYGFHRNLKGPQDEINHRRSKGLHLLNTVAITVEEGSGLDGERLEDFRRELHRSDGVRVLPNGAKVITDDNSKKSHDNFEMMNEAKAEIENFGPNPALIGQGVQAKSGRAIALLQQAGIAELGPFLIGYRAFKTQVYRGLWWLVQRNWQAERWVRVTDDQGMAQFLKVNKLGLDEYGQPTIANALGHLDVDLIVDEGPDNINSQADAFEAVQNLAQVIGGGDPRLAPIITEALLELAPIVPSVKKGILSKLEQAMQPNPMAQQGQQIEMAGAAAKVKLTEAQAFKAVADAHKGTQGDTEDPAARAAELGLKRAQTVKTLADAHKTAHGPWLDAMNVDLDRSKQANDLMVDLATLEQNAAQQPGLIDSGYTGQQPDSGGFL